MASYKPSPSIAALPLVLLILFICFKFFIDTNPTDTMILLPPVTEIKVRRELTRRFGDNKCGGCVYEWKPGEGNTESKRPIGSEEGSERAAPSPDIELTPPHAMRPMLQSQRPPRPY